ncbi:hypothetical protein FC44_GL000451 [Lactobacillus intestinalis DSM 6629]|uniref:Surface layer protein A domain-containing protein n=2 Tax=Lactobacillus intestinalis TaxID=151781 RepID=A0ABR5PNE7_9LACO|nr:hypothetical protein FC44_GL000451 [Lactobacillus intestinalis DSM 6629]
MYKYSTKFFIGGKSMKHKYLTAAMVSIILAGSVGTISTTITPTQTVQAVNSNTLKARKRAVNRNHFQKVVLTKQTYIRQIYLRVPAYKSTLGYKTYLAEGDPVYVEQTGADFGWFLKIPGDKGVYTILRNHNDYSWFKLAKKANPVSSNRYSSKAITKKTRVYRLNKHGKAISWDYYDLEKNDCIKLKRASHGKYHWDILWTYDDNNHLLTNEIYTTKRSLSDTSWFENDN